jgi:hypothetical protein
MIISNITEFFFFVNNNGFQGLHGVFNRFSNCVNQFNGTCSCKAAEKTKKLNECQQLYIECVNILPIFKSALFSKFPNEAFIELRNNSVILNTIRR